MRGAHALAQSHQITVSPRRTSGPPGIWTSFSAQYLRFLGTCPLSDCQVNATNGGMEATRLLEGSNALREACVVLVRHLRAERVDLLAQRRDEAVPV